MACNGLHPRVGIFAIINDERGRILIGRRLSKLGHGHWGFPGGHLEYGENFFECVEREVLEETGLDIKATEVVGLTNDKFTDVDKHYVTVFTKCQRKDVRQQPQTMEPDKCEGWVWMTWPQIRAMANRRNGTQELFLPVENLVVENQQLETLVGST